MNKAQFLHFGKKIQPLSPYKWWKFLKNSKNKVDDARRCQLEPNTDEEKRSS